jgi:hypothetical protein
MHLAEGHGLWAGIPSRLMDQCPCRKAGWKKVRRGLCKQWPAKTFVKGQVVNRLGFVGCMAFVTCTQLCLYNVEIFIDNT